MKGSREPRTSGRHLHGQVVRVALHCAEVRCLCHNLDLLPFRHDDEVVKPFLAKFCLRCKDAVRDHAHALWDVELESKYTAEPMKDQYHRLQIRVGRGNEDDFVASPICLSDDLHDVDSLVAVQVRCLLHKQQLLQATEVGSLELIHIALRGVPALAVVKSDLNHC